MSNKSGKKFIFTDIGLMEISRANKFNVPITKRPIVLQITGDGLVKDISGKTEYTTDFSFVPGYDPEEGAFLDLPPDVLTRILLDLPKPKTRRRKRTKKKSKTKK